MSYYALAGDCQNLYGQQVTIASGASESEAVASKGMALVGIVTPAAWTAADLAVKAGLAADAMLPAYDNAGNPQKGEASTSQWIAFPTSDAVFAPYIGVQSVDAAGAPVVQADDRTLTLIFRNFLS
jgi:hypothetical protein